MSDYLHRVAVTEAQFRADIVSGLHREAERLRDHRAIAVDQPAAANCLEDLAAALLTAADVLRAQDGRLARALRTDTIQTGARPFATDLRLLRRPTAPPRYPDAEQWVVESGRSRLRAAGEGA